jgi:hypothetical protein
MDAVNLPQTNAHYGPPQELEESQCQTIPAYDHEIQGGSCDGLKQVVVAYKLSPEELAVVNETGIIFVSMIGGLVPHYPSVTFELATHPA